MSKNVQNAYMPDYVSPPGETLDETLATIGMSQAELAQRMGRPKKTINEIVQGKAAITPETALQLELVLGIPASFWNQREQQYREFLARNEAELRLSNEVGWLDELPVKEMIRQGWVEKFSDKVHQLCEVLRFFGVSSPDQWRELWMQEAVAFRKPAAFDSNLGALSAWLRQGERVAQAIDCSSYDEKRFQDALVNVRGLTQEPPEVFHPQVTELCAHAGVAVVFVPELPRAAVCGATRWLTPTKALIQLSLRYRTDDHLWFTFFHEAGHILRHGKREVFLEGNGSDDAKEREADQFAADILIPPKEWERLTTARSYGSKAAISTFAGEIGIAPGIVVGRLQHDGLLPFRNCNDLKRRFTWAER